ncbi:unnamed protein product [Meganyctiphanes norvegica]|uniref:Uncharacterized protein n=1 Tax=Meganyctiphanes norvegica TaxID=48144 RepID=A0AAV2R8X8_MEGNR
MSGLCILTLTVLIHIIPGSICQADSAAEDRYSPVQYDEDHHLRRLQSDTSSSKALRNPKDMLHTLFRNLEGLLKDYSIMNTSRRKYKRSPQASISLEDSRKLKQIWNAYNRKQDSQSVAEGRYFGFPSFDAWASSFTMYFARDMAFNVFKIVGLSALYYLAPGVLTWYTQTFGST